MTSVQISGNAGPAFCVHGANALGTKVMTGTALGQINPSLQTGVDDGTTNVMTQFLGLTDLNGVAATGFTIGVADASLDSAKGTWVNGPPDAEDWWFLGDHSAFNTMGLPTGQLMNGKLAARALTGGPSNVSLTLLLSGSPALLEMLNAKIAGAVNGTPAPNVPAAPPAKLANGLTVFQTITANGAGQGLCGDITVESLAQIPIPQVLTTGMGNCNEGYTYCGMGMPVSSTCNSLLDVIVNGCHVLGFLNIPAVNATQPDVPSGATVKALSVGGTLHKVTQTTAGDKDAYSSYLTFAANRAHFTGETCATTADCQSGTTCQTNVCK
jgi:hypothetical protein